MWYLFLQNKLWRIYFISCCSFSVSLYLYAKFAWVIFAFWPFFSGERDSSCYGSVFQGQFEGTIHTGNGTYHVESMHRYDHSKSNHHSIIYHENDVGRGSFCFAHCIPVGSLVTFDCLKCVWGRNVLELGTVWANGNDGRNAKKEIFYYI